MALEHVPLLMRWREDPVTRRFNPLTPLDEAGVRAQVEQQSKPLEEGRSAARYMVLHDGVIVGTVVLKGVDWLHRLAEVGVGVAPEHRGRGHASAALRSLLSIAFEDVGLERVWATAHCDNVASHRALGRAGFVREGLLRKHYVIEGRRVDHVLFGVLGEHWREAP